MQEHPKLPGIIMPEGESEVLKLHPRTSLEIIHGMIVREQNTLSELIVMERFWSRKASTVKTNKDAFLRQLGEQQAKIGHVKEFMAYLYEFKAELETLLKGEPVTLPDEEHTGEEHVPEESEPYEKKEGEKFDPETVGVGSTVDAPEDQPV